MPTQTGKSPDTSTDNDSRTIIKLIVITIIKSVSDFVLRVSLIRVMYKKSIHPKMRQLYLGEQ